MSMKLIPNNKKCYEPEFPSAFWPAFCVETPVSEVLRCHYKTPSKMIIVHDHDGYAGGNISEAEALEMLDKLNDYVETDDYLHHEYFAERKNQMESVMAFLVECGGFRAE